MRIFKINGNIIDVDEQTAIGITLQSYDIKDIGKKKVNISNTFTIPLTANNLNTIGYAGNPQFNNTIVYDSLTFDYYLNNEHLISSARLRVDDVSERISLFIFDKNSVWDDLKLLEWGDFVIEFLEWLQTEKSVPSESSPFIGSLTDFLFPYSISTDELFLPMYFGNLYNKEVSGSYLEDSTTIYLKYHPNTEPLPAYGGHFCAYVKTIFEFIEYKYDVNFCVNEVGITGNIWDDAYATALYIPMRLIDVKFNYNVGVVNGFYFGVASGGTFDPLKDAEENGGKSLYTLVNSFMQIFNIVKDDIEINNQPAIRLARFDDIKTKADVVDFSGGITGKPSFKPYIPGFNQKNYIKYSDIFEQGADTFNSRVIECGNKNLDAKDVLFEIDSYICAFIEITGGVVPDLSVKESFKTIPFFISSGQTSGGIDIYISDNSATTESTTLQLYKPALYSLAGEYTFMDEILQYPKYYEINKWLTTNDIRNLVYFRQYYIRELNGCYFINKISNFNPEKAEAPTKIELFKISDKAIVDQALLVFYQDGIDNDFVDGYGNKFF